MTTPSPTATLTLALPEAVPPTPVGVTTGLVYGVKGELWRVTGPDQAVALDVPYAAELSPDGTQAVYVEYEAGHSLLMRQDLLSGEQWQLLDREGYVSPPLWGTFRPEWIIVGDGIEPTDSYGNLAVIRPDGSDFHILDAGCASNTIPALSPDGELIAYDRCGALAFYRWDSGPESLDLADFGLASGKSYRIGSPAWSPDGTRLAWGIGGDLANDDSWRIGILVLDLEAHTHDILFNYEPVGRGGWPPAPVWSPDGQWLTFEIWGEDGRTRVVRVDGKTDVHLLGRGRAVWSPDGTRLAYDDDDGLMVVDIATWQSQPGLPLSGAEPVAWLAPQTAYDPATWDVVTETLASPDGRWVAQQTTAYPAAGKAGRIHKLLTVSRDDGERVWTLEDRWEEGALGALTLRPVQWSRNGCALYLSHVVIADGCPGLTNGPDLLRFDVDAGMFTELLPSQGRTWLSISPNDRMVTYGALTLRDLATGEERHVPLDVPEDAMLVHIVWSSDGRAVAFTIVEGHCGPPEARVHTVVYVDARTMMTRTLLVDEAHGFVTAGWSEGNYIQLEDSDGQTWWLDALTGAVAPDGEAATLVHTEPFTVCQSVEDWVRPTEAEQMTEIWSIPRYQNVPIENLRETFQQNFYRYHGGASELSMWGAMGLWNTENNVRCGTVGHRAILDGEVIELWVVNHRVQSVQRTSNVYTVTVAPADGYQIVQILGIGRPLEKTEADPTVIRFVAEGTVLETLSRYSP